MPEIKKKEAGAHRILQLTSVSPAERLRLLPGVERIFFTSAATQEFRSEGERMVFYDRWLGRYLKYWPAECFIALDEAGEAAAYIVGCLDSAAAADIFKDIDYYQRLWRQFALYPAHLHMNTREDLRGRGLGTVLIETLAAHAKAAGACGLHAVTAATSRAVGFYEKCGFRRATALEWQGRTLVMLGKKL